MCFPKGYLPLESWKEGEIVQAMKTSGFKAKFDREGRGK